MRVGCVAQWIVHLTRNQSAVSLRLIKGSHSIVSLSKKLYPHCLVLVASRNRFKQVVKIS